MMKRLAGWLPRLVARARASIYTKLLVAFLAIVAMMLASGLVGLRALSEVNTRAEDMVQLQRKIAAYRQLNHDTIGQLYSVASSLLKPDERTLEATLRQLNQFGYDLDRLQFVAQDEKELFARVRQDYEEFIRIVTQVVELIRSGRATEGRDLQLARATPLADRLERLTNELVNKAESDMVASIEATHDAYIDFAPRRDRLRRGEHPAGAAARLFDLLLHRRAGAADGSAHGGDRRRRFLQAGAGAQPRRAGRTGRRPEPDERRAGTGTSRAGGRQPAQIRIPGQHVARAAHAAQRHHRILRGAEGRPVRSNSHPSRRSTSATSTPPGIICFR